MKLSQETVKEFNQIHSYGDNFLLVELKDNAGKQTIEPPFILTPSQVVTDWQVSDIQTIQDSELSELISLDPEVLIFVTGSTISAYSQKISYFFSRHQIGVEFMSFGAACRTYNLLLSEGRRVVLAICH